MILLPYATQTVLTRWPVANLALIAVCSLVSLLGILDVLPDSAWELLVLDGWAPIGMVGHLLLHDGFLHLFFNMWALWVFGNPACETTGSLRYAALFLACGLAGAVTHNLISEGYVVGASGAINGVIGFYLVLFPTNKVSCFYWIMMKVGTFEIAGYWLVAFWFLGDLWGVFFGNDRTAYGAHLGGVVAGLIIGFVYVKMGWSRLQWYDQPGLADLAAGKTPPSTVRPARTREQLIREYRQSQAQTAQPWEFPCPHCQTQLQVAAESTPSPITCPACGGSIEIES